jgi:2-polyprenyl-6-methoxyphenol hydroxylase-like FAD-dependent oxidoreductase
VANDVEVLIVGAGPTGLAHALWLTRAGVRVRIIDRQAVPGTTSRAVGVAARTLELYRQLGIADEVVAAGWKTPAINFWVRGERAAHVEMAGMGEGQTPYPFELMFPQGPHEELLIRALAAAGVTVDRPRALVGFTQDDAGVTATLDDGTSCRAAYLAGCDGAHSAVRELLGIGLPGGTYAQRFFVADLEGTGQVMDGELHISLDTARFLAAFPLAVGRVRVVGNTLDDTTRWDEVAAGVTEHLHIEVSHVRDFSSYRVHHRVADEFRRGRAFLLGDACHLHSPAGAQGMNTGIGDAINLGWKLAAVLRGAPASMIDSYEPERRGFANRLVATTDRIFQLATREGGVAEFIRTRIAPHALHAILGLELTRQAAFRVIGQLEIAYRDSELSAGKAGKLRGGDRLPWLAGVDNFAPLASRAWQLHVHGDVSDALRSAGLPLHVFAWDNAAADAGFARDAAYLIRPDGYIGWAGDDADELAAYRARVGA